MTIEDTFEPIGETEVHTQFIGEIEDRTEFIGEIIAKLNQYITEPTDRNEDEVYLAFFQWEEFYDELQKAIKFGNSEEIFAPLEMAYRQMIEARTALDQVIRTKNSNDTKRFENILKLVNESEQVYMRDINLRNELLCGHETRVLQ